MPKQLDPGQKKKKAAQAKKKKEQYKKALRAGKRRAARSKPGTPQTKLASPDDPIPRVAMGYGYDRTQRKSSNRARHGKLTG